MANHKSSIKRIRQNSQKNERNRVIKAAVRTAFRKAKLASEAGAADATTLAINAERLAAKAASKGIYKLSTISRKISRTFSALAAKSKKA